MPWPEISGVREGEIQSVEARRRHRVEPRQQQTERDQRKTESPVDPSQPCFSS